MTPLPDHSRRARPALRALAEADPALAALSLWCHHQDGDTTQTTGNTITYGPDFPDLALHEQIGLAAHHILHIALRHPARMDDLQRRLGDLFDATLYNLAADALVNEALLLADHALPRPAVTLTEVLSKVLGQQTAPETALSSWDTDRLYFALTGADADGKGARDAAQAYARAQKFDHDLTPEQGGQAAADDAEQAARWRQHLARALDTGRQAGRGIGRIGHHIADIPEPRTPWEVILRRLVTQAVTVQPQTSMRRPARRWIAGAAQARLQAGRTPGFEPGQRLMTEIPRIAVAVDASGSIDDARLAVFWAEVTGIARRMRAELYLMVFDDRVHSCTRIDPAQTSVVMPEIPRGGGTAFAPVIEQALSLQVSCLVVLTDLEGETGPPPRGIPVIWAVPHAGSLRPPFGRLVDLSQ